MQERHTDIPKENRKNIENRQNNILGYSYNKLLFIIIFTQEKKVFFFVRFFVI